MDKQFSVPSIRDEESLIEEVPVVVENNIMENLLMQIPEEEQAQETGEKGELEQAKALGFFSPVKGMAHIEGALEGRIFARIYQRNDGKRFIEYCQQYSDGSYSPKILVSQADIRIAARYHFASKEASDTRVKNKIAKFVMDSYEEYLGKSAGTLEEELEITEILQTLLMVMPCLPVCAEEPTQLPAEELYRTVLYHLSDTYCGMLDDHRSYWAIDNDCMESIASAMCMKTKELLKRLKECGFLFLTESSRGYKTNVRVAPQENNTSTQWMYCLLKHQFFVEKNVKVSQVALPKM